MIPIEKFYNSYVQTLGIEGSRKLVDDAVVQAGLFVKKEYRKEEALKVCEVLKQKKGFIKIIAGFMAGRAILDKS
ncbi:MAG: hypothetical protein ABII25_10060 [bacterium]